MTRRGSGGAGGLRTPPLELRNRLSALIIRALSDAEARRTLLGLATRGRATPPPDWLEGADDAEATAVHERAGRAATAVATVPLGEAETDLRAALRGAALLFDAGLYFEVHELLEPHWIAGQGGDREALQGLIQIAVGYQHLANANLKGARALLHEGSANIQGRRIAGLDLDGFGRGVGATLSGLTDGIVFDWAQVPRFPSEE